MWAIILMSALAGMVYGGMKLVSQLGLFFAAVVGLTLASYYAGLIAAPMSGVSPAITGLSTRTLSDNWGPGYSEGVTFSDVLSVFFRASGNSRRRQPREFAQATGGVHPVGEPSPRSASAP